MKIKMSQMMKNTSILVVLIFSSFLSCAQDTVLYKKIDSTKLFLELYYPDNMVKGKEYPAMIFFFGGGWIKGNREHFIHHARHFAKRGLVSILADYRTEKSNRTTPFESLKDAKSAIRFLRKNTARFGIDSGKIIAAGGSAGGHLAASSALIEGYNESSDDISISCIPNALVLFNPVIDNGPGGYGYERIGNEYKDFSPLHNIQKGAPPTIIFLGDKDQLVPAETAAYYKTGMERIGNRCELKIYEGKSHGFFNYKNRDMYEATLGQADGFLVSLGYLENN